MRIILLQDIPHMGKKDGVKEVRDGYARNFLIPQRLVIPATPERLKAIDDRKRVEEGRQKEILDRFHALADQLKSSTITIKVKLGKRGKAFGSVSAAEIIEALVAKNIHVQPEWILLEEPIKTTGEKVVPIKLPHDIESSLKIVVEGESS